ncbi:MAG: UDP-N-acetylmuramate dehydrogenase [Thermodesulfobacteriota bacterium]
MLTTELNNQTFKVNISKDVDLGPKTGFRTGGKADFFAEPENLESLINLLKKIKSENSDFNVIGGGTNTLVKDTGIKYVINPGKYFSSFLTENENEHSVLLRVQSGVKLPRLCWYAAARGYLGLNCLTGIPGLVGGAVFMNAGTDKGNISSVIKEITAVDESGNLLKIKDHDLIPGYRKLDFKNQRIENYIIIDVLLELDKTDKNKTYKEAKELIKKRKEKQPLKLASCGSFFKNPSSEIPAGMLIEKAGLKGKSIGGAEISKVHANFITNKNNATTQDILKLKELVQKKVKQRFNIDLKPEVKIVGR